MASPDYDSPKKKPASKQLKRRDLLPPGHRNSPFLSRRRRSSTDGLHNPRNSKVLLDLLAKVDDDTINDGDPRFDNFAPLYSIIINKRGRERFSCVLTLLVHSKADPNLPVDPYATVRPLHTLAMYNDIPTTKAMIAFGANLNQANAQNKTPLDIAATSGHFDLAALLYELGGLTAEEKEKRNARYELPKLPSFDGGDDGGLSSLAAAPPSYHQLVRQVEAHLEQGMINFTASGAFPVMEQMKELFYFHEREQEQSLRFRAKAGSRVLCLDGGGIRGLLQIEILMQIEEMTQRKITEIFDWIVGTSTGAIIALALVYAKMSLREIQQLYFQLKDKVFGRHWMRAERSGEELDRILKDTFGESTKMTDIQHPKVLITAGNIETLPLKLKFFNNCFTEAYKHPISEDLVWRVARYTSSSPMHFGEQDHYVDGGVFAQNPCDIGFTVIQEFYRNRLSIAVVVSVGSGRFPAPAKAETVGHITFSFLHPIQFIRNMKTFAGAAIGHREYVTEIAGHMCTSQGILFSRFDPELKIDRIESDETNDMKLVDMIIETKRHLLNCKDLEEFVQILHQVAAQNRESRQTLNRSRRRCQGFPPLHPACTS